VAGHELPAVARGEADPELLVEPGQLAAQLLGTLAELGRVRRAELGHPGGDRVRDRGVPQWREPDVRIEALLGRVRHTVLERHVARLEGRDGADVERGVPSLTLHGLVDRGLEAVQVQDQVGLRDASHLPGRELQVVRFGAGGREVLHVGLVPAESLGQEGQRVEGRRDVQALALTSSGGRCAGHRRAAARREGQAEDEGEERHGGSHAGRGCLY
jgi:hypothetical protein